MVNGTKPTAELASVVIVVSVGASLTGATLTLTCTGVPEKLVPSKACPVKAGGRWLAFAAGVHTHVSPAPIVVLPVVTSTLFFVSVPLSTASTRKLIGLPSGSTALEAVANVA